MVTKFHQKSDRIASDAIVQLLKLGGGFGQTKRAKASADHWPDAAWERCNAGPKYGIRWARDLGPSSLHFTDIANIDGAPTATKVVKLR